MDFWDIFIDSEQIANKAAMEVLAEQVPSFGEEVGKYSLNVFTTFEDLDSITSEEFLAAISLISNIKEVDITPKGLILLYKFYSSIFSDFEDAGTQVFDLLGCKSVRFFRDGFLEENFRKSVGIYSNFADTSFLEELNWLIPDGKLFVIFGNKIIIYYLARGKE
jgi:hypothetical protein